MPQAERLPERPGPPPTRSLYSRHRTRVAPPGPRSLIATLGSSSL
ncbi:MAG: hypothetical protein QOD66_3114, partial [Solirubrobacteraceae bacterium]|nr:hypothetical protein [Solirubrobacteraceae bacterium]